MCVFWLAILQHENLAETDIRSTFNLEINKCRRLDTIVLNIIDKSPVFPSLLVFLIFCFKMKL